MTATLRLLDRATWDGQEIAGDRVRTLLATLVAAGSEGVGVQRLEELLWTGERPVDPRKALQVIVSRTRKLTSPDTVERLGSRYRCGLEVEQIDVWRLRHQVRTARRAAAVQDWATASGSAEQVLSTVVGGDESGPLGELRLNAAADIDSCRGLLGEAASRLGDHARAVPVLQPLVEGPTPPEPLLEAYLRSVSEISGTADALTRYEMYRRELADRLGTSPGERLRALHAEFLAREDPQRSGTRYDETDLVGRGADVTAVRELIRNSRVVTVLGSGGLGKTRLAHVIGRGAAQPIVHFVELAGVVSSEGVLAALTGAIGVRETTTNRPAGARSTDPRTRLVDRLGSAPTLLILDNCEQVVDAVADLVAALVTQVQALTVLTTSRTALGIRAERVYPLPQLGHDDAVTLFRDRALAARPGVELAADVVGALVDRLDGLPLAIELAAARVRAMSVATIASRLDQRFALLRGNTRGVPERHQTLQAVIDWSWNLLDAADRHALTTLAAFHDGFDLAGAEWVIGKDALTRVESLVAQSLLTVVEDGSVRYRMLETVREFGRDQLTGTSREQARVAVRGWAIHVCRTAAVRFFSPDQIDIVDALSRDEGNLTAELDLAIAADDSTTTAAIGATLINLWQVNGGFLRTIDTSNAAAAVIIRHPITEQNADAARDLLAWGATFQSFFAGHTDHRLVDRLAALGPGSDPRTGALVKVSLMVTDLKDAEPAALLDLLTAMARSEDRYLTGLAARLSVHVAEGAGDLRGALHAVDVALSASDDAVDGPWESHSLHAERAGLLLQSGRRIEAAREAMTSVDVLRRLHAVEDVVQQRTVIALGAIDAGDLAAAERQLHLMKLDDNGNRSSSSGWLSLDQVRAELAVAQGDQHLAARLHYAGWCHLQRVTQPLAASLDRSASWLLAGRSIYLHTIALSDPGGDPGEASRTAYADGLSALTEALSAPLTDLDHPAAGALAFAVGRWVLTHCPHAADVGVALMLHAHALGYNQMYPSMDWNRAVHDVEGIAPGLLDRARPEIGNDSAQRFGQLRVLIDHLPTIPQTEGDDGFRR